MKRSKHKTKGNKEKVCVLILLVTLIVLATYWEDTIKVNQQFLSNIQYIHSIEIEVDDSTYITESNEIKSYITQLLSQKGLSTSNFGFFYYNPDEGEYYIYNENTYFTAASTVKVPVAMYYYDLINSGEISLDDTLTYNLSNYEAGNGNVTNYYTPGAEIDYETLLEEIIVNSDNTANNILIANIGKTVYRTEIAKYSNRTLSDAFYSSNATSPGYAMDVIKYLYKNSDNYKTLIEDMKESSFGMYLKHYLTYEVAHKYGSYNGYVHDYGIIYGEQTYLIGVFTKNVDNAEELIATIAEDIVSILEK